MSTAPRLIVASLPAFVAALVFAPSLAAAAPVSPSPAPATNPSQPAPAPVAPAVQRPSTGPTASSPTPTPAPATPSPGAQPAPTTPGTTATTAPTSTSGPVVPTAPTPADLSGSDPTAPADPNAAPADPAAGTPPAPTTPGLAEQLLGPSVNRHPSERPAGRVRSEEESAEQEDAAIAAMYRDLYRPSNNPGRLNIVVRGTYMLAGSVDNTLSGRLGGITADIGQSFNKFGYALTVAAHFGSLIHTKKDSETQTIALLGGGPTVNLGRLALLQRGFLDARVGYDFFAGPTRQIVDGMATADGIRAPHGPRLSINMGLLSNPARARKLFHGFGLTIGYQALVHSLRGEFPVTNVLQFGIVYWGG